jgi:hypothetical protein
VVFVILRVLKVIVAMVMKETNWTASDAVISALFIAIDVLVHSIIALLLVYKKNTSVDARYNKFIALVVINIVTVTTMIVTKVVRSFIPGSKDVDPIAPGGPYIPQAFAGFKASRNPTATTLDDISGHLQFMTPTISLVTAWALSSNK